MGSTDLALSWKDHHGVLFTVFEKLLAKKALVDCTLAAEGKFLKAHRIVLSACSPYFEALLDQEYDKHPIIFLRDVQFEDLKTLLEFVYSGEIKIPEDRLVEFLNVAEALQIKGLGGAGSESPVKHLPSKSLSKKETDSPLPRKRSRHHSSSSEGNSCDRAEIIPISSEKSRPIKSNETKVPELSASAASNKSNSVNEELSVDVSKVKKEIINPPSSHSETQLDHDQGESSEEILGLKPEFEQVTFTEDYSDDMLPEDNDSELNQDQPSSSHQYSGFASESVNPGEMPIHAPYAVGSAEPSVPEGPKEFFKKRKKCSYCPPCLRRMTKYPCQLCWKAICLQCARNICGNCFGKINNSSRSQSIHLQRNALHIEAEETLQNHRPQVHCTALIHSGTQCARVLAVSEGVSYTVGAEDPRSCPYGRETVPLPPVPLRILPEGHPAAPSSHSYRRETVLLPCVRRTLHATHCACHAQMRSPDGVACRSHAQLNTCIGARLVHLEHT